MTSANSQDAASAIYEEARVRQRKLAAIVGARVAALEAGAKQTSATLLKKRQGSSETRRRESSLVPYFSRVNSSSPHRLPQPAATAAPTPEKASDTFNTINGGHHRGSWKSNQTPLAHWEASHHQRMGRGHSPTSASQGSSPQLKEISMSVHSNSYFANYYEDDSPKGGGLLAALKAQQQAAAASSASGYVVRVPSEVSNVERIANTSTPSPLLDGPSVPLFMSPMSAYSPAELSVTQARFATAPGSPINQGSSIRSPTLHYSNFAHQHGASPADTFAIGVESDDSPPSARSPSSPATFPELEEARALIRQAMVRLGGPLDNIKAAKNISVRRAWSVSPTTTKNGIAAGTREGSSSGALFRTFSASTYEGGGDELLPPVAVGRPKVVGTGSFGSRPASPQTTTTSTHRGGVAVKNASFGSHHSNGGAPSITSPRPPSPQSTMDEAIAAMDREQALLAAAAEANRASRRQVRGLFLGEIEDADDILDGPKDDFGHNEFANIGGWHTQRPATAAPLSTLRTPPRSANMSVGRQYGSGRKSMPSSFLLYDSPIVRDAVMDAGKGSPLVASLLLDSVGTAMVANRSCAMTAHAAGFVLDTEDEKDWDSDSDEGMRSAAGMVGEVTYEIPSMANETSTPTHTNPYPAGFPRPASPVTTSSQQTTSFSSPIPSHVSRTRPPSMVKPSSPYMPRELLSPIHLQPNTPRRRSIEGYPAMGGGGPSPLPPRRSAAASPIQSNLAVNNDFIEQLGGYDVSPRLDTHSPIPPGQPIGTSFFKGLTVPPERQRIAGTYFTGGLVGDGRDGPNLLTSWLSHRSSFAGGKGQSEGPPGKRGTQAAHTILTDAERRRQLRDLNQDELGPRPLTTEEVAVQVLGVEPQLGRLLAKQLDAFDRAILDYGTGYVLGGDTMNYTASLKAPAVTICPKVRQEARHSRLIHGWKLRRLALVGKFLYIYRYPGGGETGDGGVGGGNGSSGSNTPSGSAGRQSPITSANHMSTRQNSRDDVAGLSPTSPNRRATFPEFPVVQEVETNLSSVGVTTPSRKQSGIAKLLGLPKHKLAARNRALLHKKNAEAFEKNCVCIDISRALFDIASKSYRGNENVLMIRQHAIASAGGSGKANKKGGGFDNSIRGRSGSRYSFDASSARSGDSRDDDLVSNSSMTSAGSYNSSVSARQGGRAGGGLTRSKLDNIRPPTVQTRQVNDLSDMTTVNKAIREGAMVVLSFSTPTGLSQWIQTIQNRKSTIDAIVKTIDNPQLLEVWQQKAGFVEPDDGASVANSTARRGGSKVPSAPSTPRSAPASPPGMSREVSFLQAQSVRSQSQSRSTSPTASLGGSLRDRSAMHHPPMVSNASVAFL